MQTIPDSELLRRYAVDRAEDAFAELVSRHMDLVYSAALRQVGGDGHQAEDVTQAVFTELAKRAGPLVRHPTLPGWLYTTTRLMAARVRRTENRRLVREQEAHVMNAIGSNPSSEANWDELRPLLDDVMHELDDKDRTVVLIRYFKNQSLKEVGDAIGLGDNAARMRVDRALEKLRAALARRGVKTTGALLTSVLTANAVLAAPSGLSITVSGSVLAAAQATTTHTLLNIMSITKLKAGLIGALVVGTVATTLVLQQRANVQLRAEIEKLQLQMPKITGSIAGSQRLEVADVDTNELEALGRDKAELLRLRGQVGLLKTQLTDAVALKQSSAPRIVASTLSSQLGFLDLDQFPDSRKIVHGKAARDVGLATPAALLETWIFAQRAKDIQVMARTLKFPDGITDAEQKAFLESMDKELKNRPERTEAEWRDQFEFYNLLKMIPFEHDEYLTFIAEKTPSSQSYVMEQILCLVGDEWKMTIPAAAVRKQISR